MNIGRILLGPWRDLTALEIAAIALEQAKRDHLQACAWAEKYASEATMLKARIKRLETAVQDLAKEQQT